jgi:hypothetical protein
MLTVHVQIDTGEPVTLRVPLESTVRETLIAIDNYLQDEQHQLWSAHCAWIVYTTTRLGNVVEPSRPLLFRKEHESMPLIQRFDELEIFSSQEALLRVVGLPVPPKKPQQPNLVLGAQMIVVSIAARMAGAVPSKQFSIDYGMEVLDRLAPSAWYLLANQERIEELEIASLGRTMMQDPVHQSTLEFLLGEDKNFTFQLEVGAPEGTITTWKAWSTLFERARHCLLCLKSSMVLKNTLLEALHAKPHLAQMPIDELWRKAVAAMRGNRFATQNLLQMDEAQMLNRFANLLRKNRATKEQPISEAEMLRDLERRVLNCQIALQPLRK